MPTFDGWNAVYMETHDSGRCVTCYGSDAPQYPALSAKLLATYLTTVSGTLLLLAGQEIDMANLRRRWGIEHCIDAEGQNYHNKVLKTLGADISKMNNVMRELQLKASDHGRLPMQWNTKLNAGFTVSDVNLWLTISPDYTKWNVEAKQNDPNSIMTFWKESLALRKKLADVFIYGAFEMLPEAEPHDRVIMYKRASHETGEKVPVLLDFCDEENHRTLPGAHWDWSVFKGNYPSIVRDGSTVVLQPWKAVILCSKA